MGSGGLRSTLGDAGIWAGVVVPVLFAVQYTWLSRWWRNPTGIAIMAFDFCAWLSFVAGGVNLIWPGWVHAHPGDFDWLYTGIALAIPAIILYRMLAFEAKRRHLARRDRVMLVPSPRIDGDGLPGRHRQHEANEDAG